VVGKYSVPAYEEAARVINGGLRLELRYLDFLLRL
jgi:hypothetical protein